MNNSFYANMDYKKILNVKIPIVKCYKWHAVPLTVLSSCGENQAWIYNNYLQLAIQEFPQNEHWLEFFSLFDLHNVPNFPWLNTQSLNIGLIKDFIDLKDFLIDCLNQNNYIDLLYDLYYVDYGFTFMESHRTSNMLVYGYDLSEQVFYVMDYSYNSKNIYESIKINMDILVQSVRATNSRGIKALYQYDQNYQFKFNPDLAATFLIEYLAGQNSFKYIELTRKYNKESVDFGIRAYDYLFIYLEMVVKDEIDFNILPFCSFWEHKTCIYYLSEYIKQTYFITDTNNYKVIYDQCFAIKNLAIKYQITKNKKLISDIKTHLNDLRKIEKHLINTLIKKLNLI